MAAMFRGGGGPWALPGQYTVKLTVAGKSYTQPLTLKMDPRVKTPPAGLALQFKMAREISAAQAQVSAASGEANRLHGQLEALKPKASGQQVLADELEALDKKTMALAGGTSPPGFFETEASSATTLRSLSTALGQVARAVGSADVAPTQDAVTAFQHDREAIEKALAGWNQIKSKDVPHLNQALKQAGLPPVSLEEERRSHAELDVIQSFDDSSDE